MNGKKARNLRRVAEQMAGPRAPSHRLVESNHHQKLYPWLTKTETQPDGTEKVLELGVRTVFQVTNHPESQRGIYLRLKRQGY